MQENQNTVDRRHKDVDVEIGVRARVWLRARASEQATTTLRQSLFLVYFIAWLPLEWMHNINNNNNNTIHQWISSMMNLVSSSLSVTRIAVMAMAN